MFSKRTPSTDNKAVAAPDAHLPVPMPAPNSNPAKAKARAASLLSENLTVEGNVLSDGEVQIDGVVRGDVRVGKLSLGETGHVEGQIFSDTVEIRGRVIGAITAKQVRLLGTAYVDGDITHEQLAMETGAFFQGRSLKFQRPAAPAAAPVMTDVSPMAPKA
jgi:cytoskeletal protein CcmA (bactofilin family)